MLVLLVAAAVALSFRNLGGTSNVRLDPPDCNKKGFAQKSVIRTPRTQITEGTESFPILSFLLSPKAATLWKSMVVRTGLDRCNSIRVIYRYGCQNWFGQVQLYQYQGYAGMVVRTGLDRCNSIRVIYRVLSCQSP